MENQTKQSATTAPKTKPAFAVIGTVVSIWDELPDQPYFDDLGHDHFLIDDQWMTDLPDFADNYGLPIQPFTEDDLRFLRDFILSSAMYVEQLESFICDTSDDFWEAREHAYRIITALLIRHYEYELEG